MPKGPSSDILQHIGTLFGPGAVGGLPDRHLLDRFAARRDEGAEAAFAALVERHGPMVMSVCRGVLGDVHDAQDAFQATFLVLARKACSIRERETVGPWLHGVACRVSAKARARAARRRGYDHRAAERSRSQSARDAEPSWMWAELHEEVDRLPATYRAPVVLCYLEGLTNEEAAGRLRWPVGTVKVRLSRARERLRVRLTRRGLAPAVGLLGAMPFPEAKAAVSPALINLIARAAMGRAAGGVVAANVLSLVHEELRMMMLTNLKLGALGILSVAAVAIGAGVILAQDESKARPRPVPSGGTSPPMAGPSAEKKSVEPRDQPRPSTIRNPRVATQGKVPARLRASHVVEPPDILLVEVLEALPGRPISGERLVRPDGKISLSFYGDVDVAGLTLPEVKEKVIQQLRKFLPDEVLGLEETEDDNGTPDDPDDDKVVPVNPRDSSRVFVDVTAYNSKVYYVDGEVATPGRLMITGNDTVLDAIHFAGGLLPSAARDKVRLLRRGAPGRPDVIMPVDYEEVTGGTDRSTNYEIMPGDRLVIPVKAARSPELPGRVGKLEASATEERLNILEKKLDRLIELLDEMAHGIDKGPSLERRPGTSPDQSGKD